jgi:transposase
MRRYALRDDQWDRINGLLPGKKGDVGVTAVDNRLLVDASFIVIEQAFPGAIYRSALEIGRIFIADTRAGQ